MQLTIGQHCHHDGGVWEILDTIIRDGRIGLVLGDARYNPKTFADAEASQCPTIEVFDFADIVPVRIAA